MQNDDTSDSESYDEDLELEVELDNGTNADDGNSDNRQLAEAALALAAQLDQPHETSPLNSSTDVVKKILNPESDSVGGNFL